MIILACMFEFEFGVRSGSYYLSASVFLFIALGENIRNGKNAKNRGYFLSYSTTHITLGVIYVLVHL